MHNYILFIRYITFSNVSETSVDISVDTIETRNNKKYLNILKRKKQKRIGQNVGKQNNAIKKVRNVHKDKDKLCLCSHYLH